jgi:hypothetical protein
MPDPTPLAIAVADQVLNAVDQQLKDLQPDPTFLAGIASAGAQVQQLKNLLAPLPPDASVQPILQQQVEDVLQKVLDGAPRASLAKALVALVVLDQTIGQTLDGWINGGLASNSTKDAVTTLVKGLLQNVRQIMAQRPDVAAILDDLTTIKNLRGGPADAVAYHDFHVLQMAFRDVWLHAFDASLQNAVSDLYTLLETNDFLKSDQKPTPDTADVNQLKELIAGLQYQPADAIPLEVWGAFGSKAMEGWHRLSPDQQFAVQQCALEIKKYDNSADADNIDVKKRQIDVDTGTAILDAAIASPQSPKGRLEDLIETIQKALVEPYAFDVFVPNTYNYGLMVTYRQRWEPGPYQAGNLAATIPLAPGETRKFTKKTNVKSTRAVKEIEKSMSSRSIQSSETNRAEYDIMQRATSATNFKMTTNGSFNIGIGSIGATSEFGGNQEQISSSTKKGLHEATLKAAEEYRLERSVEVESTSSTETEQTSSGELSNPNNEITVTYLFYELQRRYLISEFLYRVRPVILVAQDVPSPEEINEGWLLQYQWIIARVLLDDSLRPALTYLNSGFAGDELSVEVKRTHWDTQRSLLATLENNARQQLDARDSLRETLVATQLKRDTIPDMPGQLKFFTMGIDPSDEAKQVFDANIKSLKTRLEYAEGALADAQDKLKQGASALETATKDYSEALQNQYNRRISIDQLRIHVKQNIIFYMQAIWDQEPVDQRFFRLYKLPVACFEKAENCSSQIIGTVHQGSKWQMVQNQMNNAPMNNATRTADIEVTQLCAPTVGGTVHQLVQVADLDNPLGYKGNYIIFPLIHSCHLTDYMMSGFVDDYLGLMDPDGTDSFNPEDFESRWVAAKGNVDEQAALRDELVTYLKIARRAKDEIIVPTGQLFIEALPGSHPLLEDFKLLHRAEDVRKVKAEVRRAELENLRLAARLAAGRSDTAMLEDPDIEKKIVVDGAANISVADGG